MSHPTQGTWADGGAAMPRFNGVLLHDGDAWGCNWREKKLAAMQPFDDFAKDLVYDDGITFPKIPYPGYRERVRALTRFTRTVPSSIVDLEWCVARMLKTLSIAQEEGVLRNTMI